MRALVAYGSKRGGTAELAEMLAAALRSRFLEADVVPAAFVDSLDGYDVAAPAAFGLPREAAQK